MLRSMIIPDANQAGLVQSDDPTRTSDKHARYVAFWT